MRNVQQSLFFTLLALATLAFLGVLNVFLLPIFWAVAFAIVFEPLNDRCAAALKGRGTLASSITLLGIIGLVVIPLLLLGLAVTSEVSVLVAAIEAGEVDVSAPLRWVTENAPALLAQIERFGIDLESLKSNISSFALNAGRWMAGNAVAIGQNALGFLIGTTLMLYLLFFLLRDGYAIVDRMVHILPLGDARERRIITRFAEVVRATIKGTFVIAAVQGTIGGVAFALLGVRGAVLWGAIMGITSLLPVVGPGVVWLPAAIMLLTTGEVFGGVVLIVVGVVVIGLADNVLRPILVGRDTRMPDYLVLLATLGGLGLFGITGLVIGPLIAALFITMWEMFEEEFGDREWEQKLEAKQAQGAEEADGRAS